MIEFPREEFPRKLPRLEEFLRLSFGAPVAKDWYWQWGHSRRTNEVEIQLHPRGYSGKTELYLLRYETNRYGSD